MTVVNAPLNFFRGREQEKPTETKKPKPHRGGKPQTMTEDTEQGLKRILAATKDSGMIAAMIRMGMPLNEILPQKETRRYAEKFQGYVSDAMRFIYMHFFRVNDKSRTEWAGSMGGFLLAYYIYGILQETNELQDIKVFDKSSNISKWIERARKFQSYVGFDCFCDIRLGDNGNGLQVKIDECDKKDKKPLRLLARSTGNYSLIDEFSHSYTEVPSPQPASGYHDKELYPKLDPIHGEIKSKEQKTQERFESISAEVIRDVMATSSIPDLTLMQWGERVNELVQKLQLLEQIYTSLPQDSKKHTEKLYRTAMQYVEMLQHEWGRAFEADLLLAKLEEHKVPLEQKHLNYIAGVIDQLKQRFSIRPITSVFIRRFAKLLDSFLVSETQKPGHKEEAVDTFHQRIAPLMDYSNNLKHMLNLSTSRVDTPDFDKLVKERTAELQKSVAPPPPSAPTERTSPSPAEHESNEERVWKEFRNLGDEVTHDLTALIDNVEDMDKEVSAGMLGDFLSTLQDKVQKLQEMESKLDPKYHSSAGHVIQDAQKGVGDVITLMGQLTKMERHLKKSRTASEYEAQKASLTTVATVLQYIRNKYGRKTFFYPYLNIFADRVDEIYSARFREFGNEIQTADQEKLQSIRERLNELEGDVEKLKSIANNNSNAVPTVTFGNVAREVSDLIDKRQEHLDVKHSEQTAPRGGLDTQKISPLTKANPVIDGDIRGAKLALLSKLMSSKKVGKLTIWDGKLTIDQLLAVGKGVLELLKEHTRHETLVRKTKTRTYTSPGIYDCLDRLQIGLAQGNKSIKVGHDGTGINTLQKLAGAINNYIHQNGYCLGGKKETDEIHTTYTSALEDVQKEIAAGK